MKNKILLIGLLIAGAIVGAVVGMGVENVDALNWLAYSKSIAISPPLTINLVIINFSFGFEFSMNVAQVLFMILAIALYPKFSKMIN